jgi:surfactin synthase thioesterase subunit
MNPDPSTGRDVTRSGSWFVGGRRHPEAKARLFLFPYAGGGPSAFGKWPGELPRNVEGYIAHYPGRGSRYHEPPIKHLPALVEQLGLAIEPLLDRPFAFFGHSLGAIIAFELARQLCQHGLPQPHLLVLSASAAPHLRDGNPLIHALPDSEFIDSLQRLNGIPSEIFNQPDVMQVFLPMLRADFEAAETYQYNPNRPALDCPIIAFGGNDDPCVSRQGIEAWASHTTSHFRSQYFPGDHFFINTARDEIIASITAEMEIFSHETG